MSSAKSPYLSCLARAQIKRRAFLTRSATWLSGPTLVAALSSLLAAGPAFAAQVAENDPRIHAARIAISTGWGKLDCYLARPEKTAAAAHGVIVAHDKLGLTPHFEDVARRLAVEG